MLTPAHPQAVPSKNSLTITLTEPLVILRTADVAGVLSQPLAEGVSHPSMLRGLLALDLVKATKISSIDVELQAISSASWSDAEVKIYSTTQVFFRATSSPSARRSMSVERGVSPDSEHYQPPLPPPSPPETEPALPALPAPAPIRLADGASQRGRMRVRRRSSADHLVFQRDPVARLNRPLASSPLSLPSATEEEVATHTPTSSHVVQSHVVSTSLFPPAKAPNSQAHGNSEDSRAATVGDTDTVSRSSSHRYASGAASPTSESPVGKHNRLPTLSLGSLFGRSSLHPDSPVHDEGRPESPQANGRERVRDKNGTKRHNFLPHYSRGRMGEALGPEEEHKESGEGWKEFRKGTYTFPISFEIPSHMPPSLECDAGSVTWRLVAKVRRPGMFTSKLSATRDVQVVSIPAEIDVEATGDILIERPWDDQLHYLFQTSGRVFAIGASFNIKISLAPLAKVQVYKLAVDLEERTDSYVSSVNMTRTATNIIHLLNLQYRDDRPLLPLSSDDPLAYEKSPLAALRPRGTSSSEMVSHLLGPGPWPIRAKLHLPADCNELHPTCRSRESTVHVTHTLCFTMRLTRGDDPRTDSKHGKRKYEVVVRTPVHILSCYARAEYTTLPRYSETLDEGANLTPHTCPCAAERRRRARKTNKAQVGASPVTPTPLAEEPSALFERTLAYERLVSGHESVLGDAPPAYDAGPADAPRSAVLSA
ncbi:hypothetical protein BJV78DRAFT_1233666 [Lactifluus subvellereus]|nr:hypothetical protein BJV78DRAFT_1233666 [Lactifluus subvellereus]